MARIILIIIFFSLTIISCGREEKSLNTLNSHFFTNEQYKFTLVDKGIKMAYLDIGSIDNPIVLLLHGEPNNSFVFRNIAPYLVKQNYRVIIPDLVGFGYSDKPKNAAIITYSNQTKWLNTFIDNLKLTDINLFAHDWGGMISLRIVAERQKLFSKVAVSYSYLFEGDEVIPESFMGFINYAKNDSTFSAGNIMDWGTNIKLPDSIKATYNQPFITKSDYNVVRKFPSLIPTNVQDNEAIINQRLNKKLNLFDKPFVTIWGNHNDLMWKGKDRILQKNIIGAKNQTHYILESNHFIQEDKPNELTQILIDFFKDDYN
ncbi:MAG: alpha/beta fold hydrolase [Lutibacter sp.]|uniref:alpha/beta fold hydrolase n=1 Tax=Lutibacter sp. TaxID=1925666 RepID=UPI0019E99FCA|nr:alpha/beta fold hydrolase [Lutibacter sp.]NOR28475.1 alpha/beta fold hydrolase [Lutibacter sp.]